MNIAVVHGKKLLNNGNLNPEFVSRLDVAIELLNKGEVELIVVSGGRTRSQFPSEARKATKYLLRNNVPKSKIEKLINVYTTIDEVKKLSKIIGDKKEIDEVYAIMSSWPMLRARLIYSKLWTSPVKVNFITAKTRDYFYYLLTEPFAILFALFYSPRAEDGMERLLNWFKIEFRNAGTS